MHMDNDKIEEDENDQIIDQDEERTYRSVKKVKKNKSKIANKIQNFS